MFTFHLLSYLALLAPSFAAKIKLQSYHVDPADVRVVGLSSGAYFTVQMHVAFSSSIKGAGVISGGPYYCSEGSMMIALTRCMTLPFNLNVHSLITTAKEFAANGDIDDTANLEDSPVYLFHGTSDRMVVEGVVDRLEQFYQRLNADVTYKKDLSSGHGFITENYGVPCSQTRSPFINNCGFDLAKEILRKLYGAERVVNKTTSLSGQFVEFDQSEFWAKGLPYGLDESAWLYVPAACERGETCKLLTVFHGCHQNFNYVRDAVIRNAGFNEWADLNNIIVLYPQTGRTATNGCWDWWGDQFDTQSYAHRIGRQMAPVKRIIDRIVGKKE